MIRILGSAVEGIMSDASIADVALQDNTSERLACVLVLDGSSSMGDGNKCDRRPQRMPTSDHAVDGRNASPWPAHQIGTLCYGVTDELPGRFGGPRISR